MKTPLEELGENKPVDIQAEREGVKKIKLVHVRKGEVVAEIGSHQNMGVSLCDVQRGQISRRSEKACKCEATRFSETCR